MYQLYLNAGDIVAGEKVPQITAATPGVSIDVESMTIYEVLGNNSYGSPISAKNAVLIPGKTYEFVAKIIQQDGVNLAGGANVYVNDVLMKEPFTADGRFFYEFTVPEADYPVYYKANGEIGIGVTLTVDTQKMCNESGTFKHAVELQTANPTYKTVFYQWYKDGVAINGATKDSYTVKTTDKNSLIHCQVTLVDGKVGVGQQHVISNVITVINAKMPIPKDGETRVISGIEADGIDKDTVKIMWWPKETGNVMQNDATYVEGTVYEYLVDFLPKDGFLLDFDGEMTVAYVNGVKVTSAGSNQGAARYTAEVVASHTHEYSDDVWDHDEYAHWQPCIKPNCPDPTEEWEMYTEHAGGTATCQTKGECAICGAEYLADHDFSVPDYQYVDDMKCANFCEHCDVWTDWDYHSGGVSDCQNKAICEFCHHEYGKVGEHSFGDKYDFTSADGHAHNCTVEGCKEHDALAAHADANSDGKCDACAYEIPVTAPDTPNTPNTPVTPNTPSTPDATEPATPDETDKGKKSGCGGSVALSAIAIVGIIGTAFAFKKKED